MRDDNSPEREGSPRGTDGANVHDLPSSSPNQHGCEQHDPSRDDNKHHQEVVGNSGGECEESDEGLLGELLDRADPSAEELAYFRHVVASYAGPLPSAEEFKRYNEADPNATRVILAMAQQASAASARRIEAEAKVLETNASIDEAAVPRGQWLSAALIFIVLILALVCVILDRGWAIALFGVGGMGLMLMNTLPTLMNRNNNSTFSTREEDEESKGELEK